MSAWGAAPKSGAWATQVDEEEEENGGILAPIPPASPAAAFPALGGDQSFPSLGEVASMKETKKDRKKKTVQKMPLGAFVAAGAKARDTSDVSLPTAPRARTDEEEEKSRGLGGGFKNYGGDRGEPFLLSKLSVTPSHAWQSPSLRPQRYCCAVAACHRHIISLC